MIYPEWSILNGAHLMTSEEGCVLKKGWNYEALGRYPPSVPGASLQQDGDIRREAGGGMHDRLHRSAEI
jgi:hypothetical protein